MPVAKSTFANVANGIDNGIIPFDAHSNARMTFFKKQVKHQVKVSRERRERAQAEEKIFEFEYFQSHLSRISSTRSLSTGM